MQRHCNLRKAGFTLVEIIAVLVILGILAAVAVPKYVDLQADAANKAVDAVIAELNGRESLVWGKVKLSTDGWTADTDVTGHADYDTGVGSDFDTSGLTTTGGDIVFKGETVTTTRTASSTDSPGRWSR